MKIDFRIEHIDPLGQGVFRPETNESGDQKITFIKKTLPGETGKAQILSEKKGVRFAKLLEIDSASPDRVPAECIHYGLCNGCDYQHTTYERELEFKKAALARHLFKFGDVPITVHGAPKRLHYRNRIQLHYDKKKKLLGLLTEEQAILPVPSCLVINPSVAFELRRIYENNTWLELVKTQPVTGHIELYEKEQKERSGHNVQIAVNKSYAHGGFTQVNYEMNELLKSWVLKKGESIIPPKAVVYDLFGGNGNLSARFRNPTVVVDQYKKVPTALAHQKFFSIDLYDKYAIRSLIGLKNQGVARPDWMIFDPPRSGLKNLNDYLAEFKPEGFFYIACQATSFARDTAPILKNYELVSVDLFDLFPSTQHFETIGIFTRRKNSE